MRENTYCHYESLWKLSMLVSVFANDLLFIVLSFHSFKLSCAHNCNVAL